MQRYATIRAARVYCLFMFTPLLQACALWEPFPAVSSTPRPIVAKVDYDHGVHFRADDAEISASEAAAFKAFIDAISAHQLLAAQIFRRADSPVHDGGDTELWTRRASRVADMLRTLSTLRSDQITILPSRRHTSTQLGLGQAASPSFNAIVVQIIGAEVVQPGCPNWSRNPGLDPANLPLSNLGCANAFNLGMMVAYPEDLSNPQPLADGDGSREADGILRYRSDKVRELNPDVIE